MPPGTLNDALSARVTQQFAAWAARSPAFAVRYARYLRDLSALWMATLARERGGSSSPLVPPDARDRRFASAAWTSSAYFDHLRQSYLIGSTFLGDLVDAAELGEHEKGYLRFVVRQFVDAMAPSNFAATNPDVLQAAVGSSGETLQRGLENLLADVRRGRISIVDEAAFEVGRNLATTAGAVVYENGVMQLIQYQPITPKIHARPLLMVPPCINKFYVLDLQPSNSFVRHALGEGHAVFMVSWRNPTMDQSRLRWDDYIADGVLKAIELTREISGAERIDALGFCVGGTLLTSALAVLAARGTRSAKAVASLTLLATLLDFEDAGEIGHLVDEASVAAREAALNEGGLLSGIELGMVFSALRDNDLIWPYVVENYLKGGKPAPFDILYWNADSTNLPGPMYCWYLRNMYLENRLREPGALKVLGEKMDLGAVKQPVYLVATREDHIVPWTSAFRSTALLGGQHRFVLGASGHIAGIINPPQLNKRSYWTGPSESASAEAWLATATEHAGSWWPDWSQWLRAHGGKRVDAPSTLGSPKYPPIEPSPGRYVRHRIV